MYRFVVIILVCVLSLPLSGCLLGLVGAGAGGYILSSEVGKSKTKRKKAVEKRILHDEMMVEEKARASQGSIDSKIQSELATYLLAGGLTKIISIHAVVTNGVITLYGNVPSPQVANRAIEAARRMKGVKNVISNIVVVEYNIVPSNGTQGKYVAPVPARQAPQRLRAPEVLPWNAEQGK